MFQEIPPPRLGRSNLWGIFTDFDVISGVAMRKPVLRELYEGKIRDLLRKAGSYGNIHEIPALQKIVVNSAISSDAEKSWPEEVAKDISLIVGQRPVIILTRKSISNFKLRAGVPNGIKVTLRGNRMYEFFYRLVSVALPLIRDFRGLSLRLDGNGNYTMGIKDHCIFPEISIDRDRKVVGMDITFVTSAGTDAEAQELLKLMGMPFMKRQQGPVAVEAA